MTSPLAAYASSLDPNPVVLARRPIRPDTTQLSRFEDKRWDLSPGIFENHSAKTSLTFDVFPERWRRDLKQYFWQLINDPAPRDLPAAPTRGRPAIRTISHARVPLARIFSWVQNEGIGSLQDLSPAKLDLLLAHIGGLQLSHAGKANMITEVRRLWLHRDCVPAPLRMPDPSPWAGQRTRDLIGKEPRPAENRTPRIHDQSLVPLLGWALRFVEDFSEDIITSFHEYCVLTQRDRRHLTTGTSTYVGTATRQERLTHVLKTLQRNGMGLPGKTLPDGSREIRWHYLGRLSDTAGTTHQELDQELIRGFELPIDDTAYLITQCTGTLDGQPWSAKHIPYDDTHKLAELLMTACFIVIAYLSGMRPGEALSLDRDCLRHDLSTGLWTVTGIRWKNARSPDGSKDPEGQRRINPWVVHPIAARAIQTVTRLHTKELLFPQFLRPQALRGLHTPTNRRPGTARTASQINLDIQKFTQWVNQYCTANNRSDHIPQDPYGRVSPSRFRRTLAWHIVRQPRGLVAAAIQYGHIATHITQGYAGNYASGFIDDLAIERWLDRIDNVEEMERYLDSGGRLSGPAAEQLRDRTRQATARFAGQVIPTSRQAAKLLRDPSLQVFSGKGMHCVFNRTTALCVNENDDTPSLNQCSSSCSNIARTDEDIRTLKNELHSLPADTLAPEIRHHRIDRVKAILTGAIQNHEGDSHEAT